MSASPLPRRFADALRSLSGRWVVLALCFPATLPVLVERPDTGIDPSWKLGMHLAREQGLVLGRDLFFTYGPWGFLAFPLTLERSLWLAAAGYRLLVQIVLFAALALWIDRRLAGRAALVAPLVLVLFTPTLEYHVLLALVLWVHLVVQAPGGRPIGAGLPGTAGAGLLGAAGAALLLIKFSSGLAAGAVIAAGMLAAWWRGRRARALALAIGFVAGGLLCGLLSVGSVGALGRFLSVSWSIAASHNDAMQRRGPMWQVWLTLTAVGLLVAGLAWVRRDRTGDRGAAASLVLPAAVLFLIAGKHAFGRQETHVFIAFSVGATLMTWIALELAGRGALPGRVLYRAGAGALAAGALILSPPDRLLGLPAAVGSRIAAGCAAARDIGDEGHRLRQRLELRDRLPLGEEVQAALRGRSVDVLTVEIAVIEAWELRWRPRPILQGYIVSNAALDAMDAEWFASPSSPERLLVDPQGVDTRHPFIDSPLAWRQILTRYEPIAQDDRWLVLGKRAHPRAVTITPVQRFIAPLNEAIPVPATANGHLEAQVLLRPSLAGRLAGIPWVMPEVRMGVAAANRQPLRRILAATAMNSFPLLDAWPNSPDELRRLFTDPHPGAPRAIALATPSTWAWHDEVDVRFFQVEWSPGEAAGPAAAVSGDRGASSHHPD